MSRSSIKFKDEAWRNSGCVEPWHVNPITPFHPFVGLNLYGAYLVRHERRQWAFLDVERACQITPRPPKLSNHSRHYNLPRVASHSWPCSRVHWVIVCTLSHASCYYRPFPLLRETKCRTLTPNLTLFLTYSQHEPRPRFFFSRLDVNLDSLSFHLRF